MPKIGLLSDNMANPNLYWEAPGELEEMDLYGSRHGTKEAPYR